MGTASMGNQSCTLRAEILHNRQRFRDMEKRIAKRRSLKRRCHAALEAAKFAVSHAADVYASAAVEAPFLELARNFSVDLAETPHPGSFLHVMTTAYTYGGHTRCVERWIENAEPGERHSCLIVQQDADLPAHLEKVCSAHGGELLLLDSGESMLERALAARRIASGYACIVLHTHMDDPIALIAFGTPEFKRPVIFFNHADHIFWLGASIADLVADLDSQGHGITIHRRGIQKSRILGIPPDAAQRSVIEKKAARKALGIAEQANLVFASGNINKFTPVADLSFAFILAQILDKEKESIGCVVGVTPDMPGWEEHLAPFAERLKLVQAIPYEQYCLWVSAADIVLDSYPVGGGTAMIDAVSFGKPVLSLDPCKQSDFLSRSLACCADLDDLLTKVRRILHEPGFAEYLYQDVYIHFAQEVSIHEWLRKRNELLACLPEAHAIADIHIPPHEAEEIHEVTLRFCRWIEPHREQQRTLFFKKFRHWLFRWKWKRNKKQFTLFGIRIIEDQNIF